MTLRAGLTGYPRFAAAGVGGFALAAALLPSKGHASSLPPPPHPHKPPPHKRCLWEHPGASTPLACSQHPRTQPLDLDDHIGAREPSAACSIGVIAAPIAAAPVEA